MRKPARVTLTVVAAMALASCNRRRVDPCQAAYFNEEACRDAVQSGGYYWNGSWNTMSYGHPYPYYYDQYHSYVTRGGTVHSEPGAVYSRSGTTVRGGFGAHGEAHGEAHGGGSHGGGAGE